ncbi:MAG: AI-2E family transporter [Chitinophagaceae bacterium]|nr:AI-2E family transporter [Chitinophagaceae bacterium]
MTKTYPFYFKSTVILFGLILFVLALSQLGDILIPLSFASMLAILLNPLCNWFQGKKVNRVVSICISLFLAIILFGGIGYFVISQMTNFSTELPLLKKKVAELFLKFQHEIDGRIGIDIKKQDEWLGEAKKGLRPLAGSALSGLFGSLSMLLLLPVYAFLFLFYKTLILNFFYEIFSREKTNEVELVLRQTKEAMQSYMFGLLLEALIVAILNTVALLILGIKYAVLIGVIGALLNILPYIGGLIAIALPVLMATITKDGFQTQLWVIVAYLIIQFIDNNFLVPYIVSSKVKINALVSILIVLMGGALWGVSGMFLSIPFIGLLKIIFDRIPELKAWGKLLGDEIPTKHLGQLRLKRNIEKKEEAV